MRKIVPVLFGLGAFLLVAGLVAVLWAPGVVKKTPVDVNNTTHLGGTVAKINLATNALESNPVKVVSITKADSKASDKNVVVFTNSTCVVIDTDNPPDCVDGNDPRLVTASTDVFATDRRTALAVNNPKYLPAGAHEHQGLVNKWPFDSKKKTYPYWEGTLEKAVPARYDRTVDVRGVKTYVYKVETKGAKIDVAEGVPGTYDDVTEIYVEPRTGAIVNQTDDQQRALEDGTKVLDMKIGFTDAQIKTSIDDLNSDLSRFNLIMIVLPLVGFLGGALVLLVAVVLLMMSGRRRTESDGLHA